MMSVHSPAIRRALHRNSPATCRSSSLWPSAELSFCHRPVSLRTLSGLSPDLLPGAHHALPSLALSRALPPLSPRLLTGLSPALLLGALHPAPSLALSRALPPLSLRLLSSSDAGSFAQSTLSSFAWGSSPPAFTSAFALVATAISAATHRPNRRLSCLALITPYLHLRFRSGCHRYLCGYSPVSLWIFYQELPACFSSSLCPVSACLSLSAILLYTRQKYMSMHPKLFFSVKKNLYFA